MLAALTKDSESLRGKVIVIRYEGPKGGPGMPEMLTPTSAIMGAGLGQECALITDGRFSGGSHGFVIGHICPEAQEGGPIALVQDGDTISIDADARTIEARALCLPNASPIWATPCLLRRRQTVQACRTCETRHRAASDHACFHPCVCGPRCASSPDGRQVTQNAALEHTHVHVMSLVLYKSLYNTWPRVTADGRAGRGVGEAKRGVDAAAAQRRCGEWDAAQVRQAGLARERGLRDGRLRGVVWCGRCKGHVAAVIAGRVLKFSALFERLCTRCITTSARGVVWIWRCSGQAWHAHQVPIKHTLPTWPKEGILVNRPSCHKSSSVAVLLAVSPQLCHVSTPHTQSSTRRPASQHQASSIEAAFVASIQH